MVYGYSSARAGSRLQWLNQEAATSIQWCTFRRLRSPRRSHHRSIRQILFSRRSNNLIAQFTAEDMASQHRLQR